MPVHERKLAERANGELLRQNKERLVHAREVIAQIHQVLAQRRANLDRVRVDSFGSFTGNAKWAS